MIVEDHTILTQSLSLGLGLEGMEPHVASRLDERSVSAEARRLRPHLVLLDLHLGGEGDALPMISLLTAKGIRVLVLTGSTDEGLHGTTLDAGAGRSCTRVNPWTSSSRTSETSSMATS